MVAIINHWSKTVRCLDNRLKMGIYCAIYKKFVHEYWSNDYFYRLKSIFWKTNTFWVELHSIFFKLFILDFVANWWYDFSKLHFFRILAHCGIVLLWVSYIDPHSVQFDPHFCTIYQVIFDVIYNILLCSTTEKKSPEGKNYQNWNMWIPHVVYKGLKSTHHKSKHAIIIRMN